MIDILLILMFIAGSYVGGTLTLRRRRTRKFKDTESSVLLTFYTEYVQLYPIGSGKIGDLHYTAIATLNNGHNEQGRAGILYRVELPFHSNVHLVGIPKQ